VSSGVIIAGAVGGIAVLAIVFLAVRKNEPWPHSESNTYYIQQKDTVEMTTKTNPNASGGSANEIYSTGGD
jgi:hypothetical protein